MRLWRLLTVVALVGISCSRSTTSIESAFDFLSQKNKFSDSDICEIYDLKDKRQTDSLITYLHHSDPIYREEAADALGSVQDMRAARPLIQLLKKETVANVKKAAAFALGQIGQTYLEDEMIEMVSELNDQPQVQAVLLEAIGKCASGAGLEFLASFQSSSNVSYYGQAAGIMRASLRGLVSVNSINSAIDILTVSDSLVVRELAAFYLSRVVEGQMLDSKASHLLKLIVDEEQNNVRSSLILAVGRLTPSEEIESTLLHILNTEEVSSEIKVSIIRAFSDYSSLVVEKDIFNLMMDPAPNVTVTASQHFYGRVKPLQVKGYLAASEKITNLRARAMFLRALLNANPKDRYTFQQIEYLYRNSANVYEQGMLLKAMAESPSQYKFLIHILEETAHPVLITAAMEGLIQIRNDKDFEILKVEHPNVESDFETVFRNAIESRDIAQIYYASIALRNPEYGYRNTIKDYSFISDVMKSLQMPRDVEAYAELQKTLHYFEGELDKGLHFPKQNYNGINWEKVKEIPKGQKVVITTSKGEIELNLLVEKAPATVALFYQLLKTGFYDGKTFHRVVPNFVVQGGCPRGDGFGGLDETIRSELSSVNYQQGVVGIASAGKDTESCQWFITLQPAFHLDGRYTAFAEVTRGLSVIENLEVGDLIIEAREGGVLASF
ncbi:peptidylprolyl isomerase [Limibacter armeniacum]|uniref:peptidylprolyl isomerase n=1 Tax=Limibacter armeniacum TaxID=466084 RepID=UPI002FE5C073